MLCLCSWLVVKSMFQCLWGAVFVFVSVFVFVPVFVFALCLCSLLVVKSMFQCLWGAERSRKRPRGKSICCITTHSSPTFAVSTILSKRILELPKKKKLCCPMKAWNVHIFVRVSWSGCLSMAYKVRIWIWNVLQIFFIGRSQPLCKGTYSCLNGIAVVMWWLSNFWY